MPFLAFPVIVAVSLAFVMLSVSLRASCRPLQYSLVWKAAAHSRRF
jgi:hypothetical protein